MREKLNRFFRGEAFRMRDVAFGPTILIAAILPKVLIAVVAIIVIFAIVKIVKISKNKNNKDE